MALDSWYFIDSPSDAAPVGPYCYKEGKNSGTGSLGDNPSATRIFIIDWEYLAEFTDDLLGYTLPPESNSGPLRRVLPEMHPDLAYFYATDVAYKGVGVGQAGAKTSTWPLAEVTVTYKPLPYAVYENFEIGSELERYVSYNYQSKAEYLQANNVGMQFVSRADNKSVQTSPGVIVPSMICQMTWHNLPAPISTDDNPNAEFKPPLLSVYSEMIGKTNSLEFDGNQ